MRLAVASGTSEAMRTRSKREPGLASIAALMSAAVQAEQGRQAVDDLVAPLLAAGRPAGPSPRSVGTFVTSGTPFRS